MQRLGFLPLKAPLRTKPLKHGVDASVHTHTFVLVHGAWSGGWSWEAVAEKLRHNKHRVYAPALSGLGERSHLAGPNITLSTHIDDIVNELKFKDLEDIVLVGHSYAGFVITGVVERVPERISSIVFLDAFMPSNGQSFAGLTDMSNLPELVPPPRDEGATVTDADRALNARKATPQPRGTFTEKIKVTGALSRIERKTFICATGWKGFQKTADALRSDDAWDVYDIDCGHDVPLERPAALALMLEEAAMEPDRAA